MNIKEQHLIHHVGSEHYHTDGDLAAISKASFVFNVNIFRHSLFFFVGQSHVVSQRKSSFIRTRACTHTYNAHTHTYTAR